MDERAAQRGVRASAFLVEPDAAGLETLAELFRAGRLIVHIDRELPLAEAATAQRIVAKGTDERKGRAVRGLRGGPGSARKVLSMANKVDRPDFDQLYRDERSVDGLPALTPWDIGGPQPVVQQLVAYGAVRGEVLDPGTGPGHNAIYYAAKGYATTGIDSSPAAIERAKANAERAGVSVNFEVADATKLAGLESRFDTVVDSAFYHVFFEDEETQQQYLQALRRATKPGARLFMFEFGRHNVNGLVWDGLPADNFERLLPASGWRLDHLGTTTYQGHFSPEAFAVMSSEASPELAERMKVVRERLAVIGPLLENHRVHMPFWAVAATRLD
jgi:SAM-dependent methyltransferase